MKVSICIPAYKHADFLKRCLDSVLEQDFGDYEIIITDDSPNNDLKQLVDTYTDNRISYYKNSPALGSPENWNDGFRKAKGEYVKIIHHDDWLASPQSLSKYIALLDANKDCEIAFSASCDMGDNNYKRERVPSQSSLQAVRKNPHILFTGNRIGVPSCSIFRNWKGYLFDPKLKWIVDTEFYMYVIKKSNNQFAYTDEILVNVGISQHQATQTCIADVKLMLDEKIYIFNKLQLGNESTIYKRSMLRTMGRGKILTDKDLKKILPDTDFNLSVGNSITAFYYFVKRKVHDTLFK